MATIASGGFASPAPGSIAQQTEDELGGLSSVLVRQRRDHVRLDRLLNQLGETAASEHWPILVEIYRLVFPHAYAEETVLWPVIRRVLPDGHELTLRVELEHQEINELTARLEALEPGSPEYHELLDRIVSLLRQDVRDEEDELLPKLQVKLSPAQLRRLGTAWEAVRRISPTRPHAVVSRRPPGNVLSALPLTVIDHSRDWLDGLLARGAGGAEQPVRALSSALKATAHAVERMPGMRRGEDRATRRGGRSSAGFVALAAFAAFSLWALARRRSRWPA
jgi:hypothetical protein